MKKIIFWAIIIFCFFYPATIFAQEGNQKGNTQEVIQEVNSFELFWPISAGKTVSDPFYWLKTLKEQIRGLLIFGNLEKADYYTFLTVKRVIESEKLLREGRTDLVDKTLRNSLKLLNIVENSIDKHLEGEINLDAFNEQMSIRLNNLHIFIPQLINFASENNKQLFNENLEKIDSILKKI